MPIRKLRAPAVALTVVAAVSALTACSFTPAPAVVSNPPTMAPEQSVSEACAISRAEVDATTQEVKDRIDQAGKDIAAGKAPDLGGIADTVGGALDRVAEGVTNPEVLEALDRVRSEISELGEIEAPDSLMDAPNYLGELTSHLSDLQAAGTALQELCTED